MMLIQYISNTAGHTGCKVVSGASQNHHRTAGHVFTAMLPNALCYGGSTGVPDTEAFAGNAVNKRFAAGGTIEGNIAYYNIILCLKTASFGRLYDQLSAG